jgi:hypothetical protein
VSWLHQTDGRRDHKGGIGSSQQPAPAEAAQSLQGRIDAIDRATGDIATIYDTTNEPGRELRIPCGNRREDICPTCSQIYRGDARQIIRSVLTGGKGIAESVATN